MKFRAIPLCFGVLALSACASNPPIDSEIIDATQATATVQPVSVDGVLDGSEIDPGSLASQAPLERVIFFDYNESELRQEYFDIVAQHGRFMAENPDAIARLEGHTDERGTREYNIALGEDRAKTIARILRLQGVNSDQLTTISFGEELPVEEAHNSDAWAQNRRVNIIYEAPAIQN